MSSVQEFAKKAAYGDGGSFEDNELEEALWTGLWELVESSESDVARAIALGFLRLHEDVIHPHTGESVLPEIADLLDDMKDIANSALTDAGFSQRVR